MRDHPYEEGRSDRQCVLVQGEQPQRFCREGLEGLPYPATKRRVLSRTRRIVVEGLEVGYFLKQALAKERYFGLREVMEDVEGWAEGRGQRLLYR